MTTGMAKKHRIIGRYVTKEMMCLKPCHHLPRFCGPFILMPSSSKNPLTGFRFAYSLLYLLHKLLITSNIKQIKIHFVVANTHNVAMTLDKTWHHHFAGKVDSFG